jgi:hypothetical protein
LPLAAASVVAISVCLLYSTSVEVDRKVDGVAERPALRQPYSRHRLRFRQHRQSNSTSKTMYSYLFYPSLLLLLFVICLFFLRSMTSPRKECEPYPRHADEKANVSQQQSVPGSSTACYVGDPSNDVLKIKALDLAFDPPEKRFIPRCDCPLLVSQKLVITSFTKP